MARCAEKRIQDFAAGRACAHRALAELGILDFSLLAGEHREPLWPADIIGSITHTQGYGAAVVARQRDLQSVGLDCEVIDSVDENLWSRICTSPEIERLVQLPPAERGPQAALIFAAKEAFYKCQFPLTRAWVGFEDVVIEPLDWPAVTGSLRIVPQKTLPLEDALVARLVSRFQFRGPWVITAVTAPN
jgi:4'-phosphopantetheinyl transferase EntD